MADALLDRNVPIVGQPFTVFGCVPLVTIRCNCKPDNPTGMILGHQTRVTCHACGRHYVLGLVHYDRSQHPDNMQVAVGMVTGG